MELILSNILTEIKAIIHKCLIPLRTFIIGSNSEGIINNTDIDIIVIVNDGIDYFIFLEQISQNINDLIISNNILISVYPISASEFESNSSEFIQNIKERGFEF
jgi:hypothetical protein|nr:MAG TPA: hypothetical protein [Caudoviricetes sp.]